MLINETTTIIYSHTKLRVSTSFSLLGSFAHTNKTTVLGIGLVLTVVVVPVIALVAANHIACLKVYKHIKCMQC